MIPIFVFWSGVAFPLVTIDKILIIKYENKMFRNALKQCHDAVHSLCVMVGPAIAVR